jgi:hypothetical protein
MLIVLKTQYDFTFLNIKQYFYLEGLNICNTRLGDIQECQFFTLDSTSAINVNAQKVKKNYVFQHNKKRKC